MKPLHDLTQVGRGRRLRPVAHHVLAEYGIEAAQLRQITEASNTIFRVSTVEADEYVLRMTSPKSCHGADEARSEVEWLRTLERDTDLGIPAPVPRWDGDYVTELDIPGCDESMCCVLYRWVPGVMLNQRLTEDNVRQLGILMARLHAHAVGFVPSSGFRIRTYESVFPYAHPAFPSAEPVVLFESALKAPLTSEQRAIYRQTYEIVTAEMERLMTGGTPLRVIHNDLHPWNVKIGGDRLYALDFEDMIWGHPIQDIATTMFYFRWRDGYETYRAAFRRGYESVGEWPETHEGQLETLIMGRMLLLANYIAVSEDSEDRAIAPEYLERVGRRLHSYVLGLESK